MTMTSGDNARVVRGKLLLADDDEMQRLVIGRVLENAGFEVVAVAEGRDVVRVARTERPDVLVLDIQMPDQDGFVTVRQVKADPTLGDTPIILLTGRADAEDVMTGLKLGVNDYLLKSTDASELVARIEKLLASRQGRVRSYELG
jgi:DNA-binding response OmpR family regulator